MRRGPYLVCATPRALDRAGVPARAERTEELQERSSYAANKGGGRTVNHIDKPLTPAACCAVWKGSAVNPSYARGRKGTGTEAERHISLLAARKVQGKVNPRTC